MLICAKAYVDNDNHNRIYCSDDKQPCAHQYWCDMACKYKLTNQAEKCPGRKEKKDGKEKTVRKTNKVADNSVSNKRRK